MGSFMSKHSLANNRFIKDMPIEHDMHRDGPKNYDTDKGSHAHPHDGPKMHKKGHSGKVGPGGASPKKSKSIIDQAKSSGGGAKKGDQSATRFDYKNYKGTDKGYKGKDGSSHGDQSATKKDYGSGGPGMMSKGPHKEKWERQANRARRANERGNTERGAKLEAKARKNYKN